MTVYSQRNNKLKPESACNVTAMCQALSILGYTFPKGKYEQEEDNLMDFLMTNERVQRAYKNNPLSSQFDPNEIHEILCYGTNLWMNKHVTAFRGSLSYKDITSNIDDGNCILLSGLFPTYNGRPINHIICCYKYDDDGIIIADSWGDYRTLYTEKHAQLNIHMSKHDFTTFLKPLEADIKWGDIVYGQ